MENPRRPPSSASRDPGQPGPSPGRRGLVEGAAKPGYGLQPASALASEAARPKRSLPLSAQLPRGRLIELVNGPRMAPITAAVSCLRYAQQRGETTAWVQLRPGSLFPPDLADSGIDLAALVIVRIPQAKGAVGLLKAAEMLLRSGGFGMVVIDLSQGQLPRNNAWQGRLLSLAREHHSWLLLIGPRRAQTSLGPLVSLRIESHWTRLPNGHFLLHARARKDKSALLGPLVDEYRRGPLGL